MSELSDHKLKLEIGKLYSEVLRNLGFFAVCMGLIIFVIFNYDRIVKITFAGISFELNTPSENPSTVQANKEDYIRQTFNIPKPPAYWVYVGASLFGDEKKILFERSFNLATAPEINMKIASLALVSKRESPPASAPSGKWELGKLLGLLESERMVTVVEVVSIPGVNNQVFWWAKVSE